MKPPKLVCGAGPYRAPSGWELECNIQRARRLGAEVARIGAYPVIPHSNTAHFDGIAPDEWWLAATMELMRRCDAVIFAPDWGTSRGSRLEFAEAQRLGLPRFETVRALADWLGSNGALQESRS